MAFERQFDQPLAPDDLTHALLCIGLGRVLGILLPRILDRTQPGSLPDLVQVVVYVRNGAFGLVERLDVHQVDLRKADFRPCIFHYPGCRITETRLPVDEFFGEITGRRGRPLHLSGSQLPFLGLQHVCIYV